MSGFVAIDLSQLPAPTIVEEISYEQILAACKIDVVARLAELGVAYDVQNLESDPVVKVLEVAAYRETLLRARVNQAVRALMLAYSQGRNLDHKGADFEVARMVVTPATDDAPAVLEDDARFRRRIQLAPEAFSTAGAQGAYIFHALSADILVVDAWAFTPADGRVDVVVAAANGADVSDATFNRVVDALSLKTVRPLTDTVVVRRAQRVVYDVTMTATIKQGPDPALIRQTIETAVRAYAKARTRIGEEVYLTGLVAAAMSAAIENVVVTSPVANVITADHQIPILGNLTVTVNAI